MFFLCLQLFIYVVCLPYLINLCIVIAHINAAEKKLVHLTKQEEKWLLYLNRLPSLIILQDLKEENKHKATNKKQTNKKQSKQNKQNSKKAKQNNFFIQVLFFHFTMIFSKYNFYLLCYLIVLERTRQTKNKEENT
jgi:hypothetical protein